MGWVCGLSDEVVVTDIIDNVPGDEQCSSRPW